MPVLVTDADAEGEALEDTLADELAYPVYVAVTEADAETLAD